MAMQTPPRNRPPADNRSNRFNLPPGNTNTLGNRFRNGNGNGDNYGNSNLYGYGGGFEPRPVSAKEQLYEILHVIAKRLRVMIAIFVAISGSFFIWQYFQRPVYVATAKVNISTDRADLTIQPTEMTSLTEVKLNEAVVNSEVHLIRSRDMLERVARTLAIQSAQGGVVGLANADGNGIDTIARRAFELESRLRVTPIRASNIIQIEYDAERDTDAIQVVSTVLDAYLEYHAEVHGQKKLSQFYDQQGELLRQNLVNAEEKLRDYAFQHGLVAPESEIGSMVEAVGTMENQLREVNGKIIGTEEKLRVVREQLREQPALVERAKYIEVNPVVRQLSGYLIDRQMDRVALLRKYTEKSRYVRDNTEEISAIQNQLDETVRTEPTVESQRVFRSNPLYDSLLTTLLELEANLKEFRARKAALEESLSRTRRDVINLKQKALEFDQLEKEVERRRATLDLYEKRAQEARIAQAMDQEKLVNVEIVQRPRRPLRQAGRRGSLWLALIAGLAASFGGVFAYEYVNRTLRFERDIEQYLGLPALGTIRDTTPA